MMCKRTGTESKLPLFNDGNDESREDWGAAASAMAQQPCELTATRIVESRKGGVNRCEDVQDDEHDERAATRATRAYCNKTRLEHATGSDEHVMGGRCRRREKRALA